MILDNENFDKTNRLKLDKMHKVHFPVRMDQYQAKERIETSLSLSLSSSFELTNLWKQSHLISMAPAATARM